MRSVVASHGPGSNPRGNAICNAILLQCFPVLQIFGHQYLDRHRIGDIYRSLPRRADVIVTTVGARHKCQQGSGFEPPMYVDNCYLFFIKAAGDGGATTTKIAAAAHDAASNVARPARIMRNQHAADVDSSGQQACSGAPPHHATSWPAPPSSRAAALDQPHNDLRKAARPEARPGARRTGHDARRARKLRPSLARQARVQHARWRSSWRRRVRQHRAVDVRRYFGRLDLKFNVRYNSAIRIQLAVGPQPLRLRNHNSRLAHQIMVKRLATSPHDPLGITDSACKNQLAVVSVRYGPFNPYIPIRSTAIGKSRVAIDPIAMHTSWRSNSDIASIPTEEQTVPTTGERGATMETRPELETPTGNEYIGGVPEGHERTIDDQEGEVAKGQKFFPVRVFVRTDCASSELLRPLRKLRYGLSL
ncbi:hypothetical protein F511_36914 [Dorcoceras hygrometricum]|uniref:Uncharacterized protein n=1 Tax=Dorcoceras hygrometricum TaxID=472368 RepID=A0A2Z7CEQ8_9LAMI|nr:hypothetical protein F511_36914 [Dorcoceras hygrometricum]